MKKLNYLYIILLLCWGCGDFLEESSQDLMIPKTVKDYKEFFYGEALKNTTSMHEYLDIMTDDVADLVRSKYMTWNDWREPMWAYYTWQAYPEIGINNEMQADHAWEFYYHKILVTNVILKEIGEMDGTAEEKADLAGECYFLRGFSYFMLANLYGKPYVNKALAQTDFCVPINREVSISDHMYTRSTVAEVYAQIESDVQAAINSFKKSLVQKTIFRPNLAASYLLASRVALFQKNYKETIAYADSVLIHTDADLCDLKTYSNKELFYSSLNTELLFTLGYSVSSVFQSDQMSRAVFVPAPELLALYKDGDLRLKKFYSGANYNNPNKWTKYTDVYAYAFRLAEVYLNRAEAHAELGETGKALADINLLRSYRFESTQPISASNQEEAISQVREERRRELAFESFRWFDLRRWGCPKLTHRYSFPDNPNAYDEYILEENSISYTLPIPQKERDLNTVIERLNRPESIKNNK